jgi:hypothetical protein
MPGKDLRQAVATFVQQLMGRVQLLIDDVTSLEVSTYSVDAPQLESVSASEDVGALAAGGASPAQRQGYTRIAFHCDLNGCTETGRQGEVDASVLSMHGATVNQALAGRETLLAVGRETLDKLRG